MNTNSTAEFLNQSIDRHAAGTPRGKVESHDLESLCARVLAPREVVEKLLAAGVLRAQSAVHANQENGLHTFLSDDLNEIRRSVLAAIVEKTVEESDGLEGSQVTLAASNALNEHVKGFVKKPGAKKEFSTAFPAGLVQLARYGEEEPGFAERAGTLGKVATVAGAGALAYGAAGYLRGRMSRPGIQLPGTQLPGARGAVADTLAGIGANNADLRRVAGRVGTALRPGAAKVAAVLAGRRVA